MPFARKVQARELAWHEELKAKGIAPVAVKAADIPTEKVAYQQIPDVLPGKAGEIVEQMSEDQLVQMLPEIREKARAMHLGSSGISVPGSAAEHRW